jgi:ADP-heptose:LPS heptosyltransferase
LGVKEIDFFSLQMEGGAEELRRWPEAARVIDHTEEIGDFADTAALLMELDLIISVDTAVAHLAGALGRPVWTLLPFVPDWRWGLESEETPWYPTMRLFRQPALGDWEAVIQRVTRELRQWAAGRAT